MIGDGEKDRWQPCDQDEENDEEKTLDTFKQKYFLASIVYYVLVILPDAVGAAEMSKL